ncbi:MAG: hypothetical protein AB7I04_21995 [Pseudomonadales bacterium]
MRLVLKLLGGLVVLVILATAGVLVAARFHDGPLELVSGGPFTSGEQYTGAEPDWSFLKDYVTVEFQLLDPVRSRTTWIVEHDNRIFIPSGYMNSTVGKLWKQWPKEAERDGRAILRVDGRLYERQLVRIRSGDILTPVLAELGRKYVGGQPVPLAAVTSNDLWIFELVPR